MRLPRTAHTGRSWRIHEVAPDFRVDDVWELPTPGGPNDLHWLVEQTADGIRGGVKGDGPVGRFLFAVRWKLGALLRLDDDRSGVGARVTSLRDRLPADLLEAPRGPDLGTSPFSSVFQLEDEWVAEMSNRTVHALMHIGWVPDGNGGHHGQMAVMVKPNGVLGSLYMAAIKPFRYIGVYPALMRAIGKEWQANAAKREAGAASGQAGGEGATEKV